MQGLLGAFFIVFATAYSNPLRAVVRPTPTKLSSLSSSSSLYKTSSNRNSRLRGVKSHVKTFSRQLKAKEQDTPPPTKKGKEEKKGIKGGKEEKKEEKCDKKSHSPQKVLPKANSKPTSTIVKKDSIQSPHNAPGPSPTDTVQEQVSNQTHGIHTSDYSCETNSTPPEGYTKEQSQLVKVQVTPCVDGDETSSSNSGALDLVETLPIVFLNETILPQLTIKNVDCVFDEDIEIINFELDPDRVGSFGDGTNIVVVDTCFPWQFGFEVKYHERQEDLRHRHARRRRHRSRLLIGKEEEEDTDDEFDNVALAARLSDSLEVIFARLGLTFTFDGFLNLICTVPRDGENQRNSNSRDDPKINTVLDSSSSSTDGLGSGGMSIFAVVIVVVTGLILLSVGIVTAQTKTAAASNAAANTPNNEDYYSSVNNKNNYKYIYNREQEQNMSGENEVIEVETVVVLEEDDDDVDPEYFYKKKLASFRSIKRQQGHGI